ncbi:MAG: hypothetical protein IJS02_00630, partial [Bacteroidales bacterium]|nr:hypothetical protein [Bacteroidales bacterium]
MSEAWPDSVLRVFSQSVPSYADFTYDWWLIGAASVTFLIFLIFFNQIINAISIAFSVFFRAASPKKCYNTQYTL